MASYLSSHPQWLECTVRSIGQERRLVRNVPSQGNFCLYTTFPFGRITQQISLCTHHQKLHNKMPFIITRQLINTRFVYFYSIFLSIAVNIRDNLSTKQGKLGLKFAVYNQERLQIKRGLQWRVYNIHPILFIHHFRTVCGVVVLETNGWIGLAETVTDCLVHSPVAPPLGCNLTG
jgi:hypothetical protein